MTDLAAALNETIAAESPPAADCLSDLGRRAAFPPDIPYQAEQARSTTFNATIGQITDGAGTGLRLPPIDAALKGLHEADRNQALLYSPVAGIPELRRLWRQRQRRGSPSAASTLPAVTAGLTHGLSLAADLFAGEGTPVAVPAPFWGNYRQTFALRRGARICTAPAYLDGRYNPEAPAQALRQADSNRGPAIVILNIPSNPGGYSPTDGEREALQASLLEVASHRPLVVICDDAYAGLVYEEGISPRSMFWDLAGSHPNLLAIKVDGGTKEFNLFGGRVGFFTLPFAAESKAAEAFENKLKCLIRATVGSPISVSQMLLVQALRDETIERDIEAVRETLAGRCRALKSALAQADPDLFQPMPFNSGCFALLRLSGGLSSESVRRHLLDHHDTGIVSIAPDFIRIAFCSITQEAIPALVDRIASGVRECLSAV